MIHFRREGGPVYLGLNITWIPKGRGKSIAFVWVWVNLHTRMYTGKGFRIRFQLSPHFIRRNDKFDYTEVYARDPGPV
jgi:hypothetical protein